MSLSFALMAAINGSTGSLGDAVARALTTAPSLAGAGPAAEEDSHPSGVAAQTPPATLSRKRLAFVVGSQGREGLWPTTPGQWRFTPHF